MGFYSVFVGFPFYIGCRCFGRWERNLEHSEEYELVMRIKDPSFGFHHKSLLFAAAILARTLRRLLKTWAGPRGRPAQFPAKTLQHIFKLQG